MLEDVGGQSPASAELHDDPRLARANWEQILRVLAGLHIQAERQSQMLRRLYAPHWPPSAGVAPAELLERGVDAALATVVGCAMRLTRIDVPPMSMERTTPPPEQVAASAMVLVRATANIRELQGVATLVDRRLLSAG